MLDVVRQQLGQAAIWDERDLRVDGDSSGRVASGSWQSDRL